MQNRIYKFRAWDKIDKVVREVTCINWFDELVYLDEKPDGSSIKRKLEDIKLMQYIELKDKNGKEIFEGDIVEIDGEITRSNPKYLLNRDVIEFINGQFLPRPHGEQFEIIGNIYENSELPPPPQEH